LKLNGAHQLAVYADDVNILGGSVHTVQKNTEALVVACKEIGLEVNADKTKYLTMSRDQNAGRSHKVKIDNITFERVEELRFLGATLTHQNSIQEDYSEQIEVRECLLSCSVESSVFQFAV
jgi:hypothetical protein